MGHKLSPLLACDLDLTTGDAGPRYGRAQEVPVLVHSVGLNRRPDEVLHKVPAQILNENLVINTNQIALFRN